MGQCLPCWVVAHGILPEEAAEFGGQLFGLPVCGGDEEDGATRLGRHCGGRHREEGGHHRDVEGVHANRTGVGGGRLDRWVCCECTDEPGKLHRHNLPVTATVAASIRCELSC